MSAARPKLVHSAETDDELIGSPQDELVLIEPGIVEATCIAVGSPVYVFKQRKRRLDFAVYHPEGHGGLRLFMWVRDDPKWEKCGVPHSAKLSKMAAVALNRLPKKRDRITKGMFLNKAFRCRVVTSGKGTTAYSVIGELIERVAG